MRTRARSAAQLTAVVLSLVAPTRSAAELVDLHWSAPDACPRGSHVQTRVASLVSQARALRTNLRADAKVSRRGSRYALELSLTAPNFAAQRKLEAARCASIADAAAWLIAIALDPELADEAGQESGPRIDARVRDTTATGAPAHPTEVLTPAGESSPGETAATRTGASEGEREQRIGAAGAVDPAGATRRSDSVSDTALPAQAQVDHRDPRATAAATPRRLWRSRLRDAPRWWRAGVFTGVFDAQLPAPQAAVGVQGGIGLGPLLTRLHGSWMFARTRAFETGARAEVWSQELGAAVCAQWGGAVRGGPCVTMSAYRSLGMAVGVREPRTQALYWGALGPSLQLGWTFTRAIELIAESGVQLPITARPRFTLEEVGEVGPARPLSVYARVGFGIRPPDVKRGK